MRRRCCLILAACLPAIAAASLSGCSPAEAQSSSKAPAAVREVPVTVAPLERRTVERTIDVVGTLRGWEQVTIGSKRTGRVSKVLHDMGDHVRPGEPLVELEAVDAKLAYDQAQSKYLGELVKLGITEQQAQRFIEQYGISEELIRGKQAEEAIDRVPAVIQVLVSKEKALHNLNRQRALSKKGASTVQELEDYENEYRSASAAYENARATARNVIASAVANRVARNQAIQTLADMIIRVPKPELTPPGSSQADAVVYAVTKRSVSEGQMVREGEAVCELIIENPLRLWTNVAGTLRRTGARWPARANYRVVSTRSPLSGQGRAYQSLGRCGQPHVSGRDPGAQRQAPAEGRRLRQGDDHHRLGSPGSRRPDRVDHPLRWCHQAVLRRERQGPVGQRHRHR